MSERRYRVVQWATGNIGTRALREVIRHPDSSSSGSWSTTPRRRASTRACSAARNRSASWRPTIGRRFATRGGLRALHAPHLRHRRRRRAARDRARTSSRRGASSSAAGTGSVSERVRLVDVRTRALVDLRDGKQPRVHHREPFRSRCCRCSGASSRIEIDEFADMSRRDSPHMLFEQMGFGKPLDSYNPRRAAYLVGEFSPSRSHCSPRRRAGRSTNGPAPVRSRPRGERRCWSRASSRPVPSPRSGPSSGRATASRSCGSRPTGTAPPTSSRRGISGRRDGGCACAATRRSTSTSRFPVPLEDLGSVTPAYTANRPVNAVPYVLRRRPASSRRRISRSSPRPGRPLRENETAACARGTFSVTVIRRSSRHGGAEMTRKNTCRT